MSQAGTQVLQDQYNSYQQTISEIQSKIQELRMDSEEHRIVTTTLENTEKSRRCFRMVGGALLEKTVGETIPVLNTKLENINGAIDQLQGEMKRLVTEFEAWKKEKNIKIIKQ